MMSSVAPLTMYGFLLLCMVLVLTVRGSEAAKVVLIVVAIGGFALYSYTRLQRDASLQKDTTRVINERFFDDSHNLTQTNDDVVYMSGNLPKRLRYVIRDTHLVKILTGISSMFNKTTFVELVARMEAFKKRYYTALRQYKKDLASTKETGKRFVRYEAWSDLKVIKKSIDAYMQSLVHQVPVNMQPKLFSTIDKVSGVMKDGIARLKRMYAYAQ